MKLTKNLLLVLAAATVLAGCGEKPTEQPSADVPTSDVAPTEQPTSDVPAVPSVHTYNTYTSLSPSNWNELTYQDNNDTQIMSYIGSSFFTFDFKFDAEGNILPGEFEVEYDAASKLEDVTAEYAGDANYAVPADATKNYAFKITLRDDLKWSDGTPIVAEDFVYTMQQQLDPLFKNYRADSFYNGSTVIHNAKNYVFQGSTENVTTRDFYDTWDAAKADGADVFFTLEKSTTVGSYLYRNYGDYIDGGKTPAWVLAALGAQATEAEILSLEGKTWAEIAADATLSDIWTRTLAWWQTDPNEELDFFAKEYTYPAVSGDALGIFSGNTAQELIVVLDSPLDLLKEDGSLSYKAAYNFSSLPLVKKDLYEANKHEPQEGSTLWTSTYNSSVESSASWGPYELTYFQAGKQYILERNENWYGYTSGQYEGQYETDRIVCETVKDWNTAWLMFQKGEVDTIGIDVSIADEYKNSSRAVFTPDDFVGSMQLQSSKESLIERQSEGVNKTILSYVDFRKALSLGINRDEYNATCSTASKAGFGLFNSMHYYDVANGGVYRNEDVAKQVLCDVYGVNVSDYDSLDDAYEAITGYNLAKARELMTSAYNAALEAGDILATDKVELVFGTGSITESTQRVFDYLSAAIVNIAVGTPLEGRIEMKLEDHGTSWANDFRSGGYDICLGGWTGAAWDPGYFLLAYLSPDYMYSTAWDTSSQMLTYTPSAEIGEKTMSLMDWYNCLNGDPSAEYNWSEGFVDNSVRLGIIAALEREILSVYYTVPLQNSFGATLVSYKFDYITTEYNTFMGYGGIRYLSYNYSDAEWATEGANKDYKA